MTMNTSLTGKVFLDGFPAALTTLLKKWVERLSGSGAWADLGVMFCFALLVLPVNDPAVAFVRRKMKQSKPADATVDAKRMQRHVFDALGKPPPGSPLKP
jgi:hypothetical protein